MVQKARISLSGTDSRKVDSICKQIRDISQKTGVSIAGPIPLPTKKLKVPVRKGPTAVGRAPSTTGRCASTNA